MTSRPTISLLWMVIPAWLASAPALLGAPIEILLSDQSVNENAPDGAVIAHLDVVNPSGGDPHVFTLIDDAGGRFGILGQTLVVADTEAIDYATQQTHEIQIRVTDQGGAFLEQGFTIRVNETPPVLNWARQKGSDGVAAGQCVATEPGGNIFVAGWFEGRVDFDPGPATDYRDAAFAGQSLFVEKLDATPASQWVFTASCTGTLTPRDMALDASDRIVIGGQYAGTLTLDPGPNPPVYDSNQDGCLFLLCLDADGHHVWSGSFGAGWGDFGSLATDSSGNTYATGWFRGTGDLDPGTGSEPIVSFGYADMFVCAVDSAGDLQWSSVFTGDEAPGGNHIGDAVRGRGLCWDGGSNLYLTGSFEGTVDFDSGAGTYSVSSFPGSAPTYYDPSDIFLLKLTTSGDFVWVRSAGKENSDEARALSLDATGNPILTGTFNGTNVDFGAGGPSLTLTSNQTDTFLWKLNTSGTAQWAKHIDSSNDDAPIDLEVQGSGELVVVGQLSETTDMDPGAGTYLLTPDDELDSYVLRLDASGNFGASSWAHAVGGEEEDSIHQLAFTAGDALVFTGEFRDDVDFDPGASSAVLSAFRETAAFITQWSSGGNLTWAVNLKGSDSEASGGVAVDASGAAVLSGSFSGEEDFDPGSGMSTITSTSEELDGFVVKLDRYGRFEWAHAFAGPDDVYVYGLALDSAGNAYVAGYFQGTVDFDPEQASVDDTLTATSAYGDPFVCSINSSGDFSWVTAADCTAGFGMAQSVCVHDGAVAACGSFAGTVDFDMAGAQPNDTLTSTGCIGPTQCELDAFVWSLNAANGQHQWVAGLGGDAQEMGQDIQSNGTIYVTGSFRGSADFDPDPGTIHNLTSAGSDDVFVVALDSSGDFVWAAGLGGTERDNPDALGLDSQGRPTITGRYRGDGDFDPGPGVHTLTFHDSRDADIFLVQLTDSGNLAWAHGFGNENAIHYAMDLAVDNADNVYISGHMNEVVDFDPDPDQVLNVSNDGSSKSYLASFDATGYTRWAFMVNDEGYTLTRSLAAQGDDVFILGDVQGPTDFRPGPGQTWLYGHARSLFITKLTVPPDWMKDLPAWRNPYDVRYFITLIL